MKQILLGVLVFLVWLVISTYWYVCGIKDLCKELKPKQIVSSLPQEKIIPAKIPQQKIIPDVKLEEKLPTIYFIFEMDSVKNVDDLISSSRIAVNYLEKNKNTKLYITGYTSEAEAKDNYELGLRRANSVKKDMITRGVPEDRIMITSKGDDEPNVSNDTQEGRMFNRRVEMVVK
ncbi:MAG: OmpA family protein [Proteobacteria bacterium]|nr:OmpA family protein [Pseudomonadota bacterium]